MRIALANQHDMVLAAGGRISANDVRRTEIEGVIDTGATRLVLPESVVKEPGRPIVGRTKVKIRRSAPRHAAPGSVCLAEDAGSRKPF